jgi:hypothetical protein
MTIPNYSYIEFGLYQNSSSWKTYIRLFSHMVLKKSCVEGFYCCLWTRDEVLEIISQFPIHFVLFSLQVITIWWYILTKGLCEILITCRTTSCIVVKLFTLSILFSRNNGSNWANGARHATWKVLNIYNDVCSVWKFEMALWWGYIIKWLLPVKRTVQNE